MNDKMKRLLGLARNAGKCALGAGAAEKAIKHNKSCLVILAENSGESTKSKFVNLCDRLNARYIFCKDKFELGEAVGLKEKSVIAITDSGFAKGVFDCIKDMEVLVYDKNKNQ